MSIQAVSGHSNPQIVTNATPASAPTAKPASPKPQLVDTVQISSASQAMQEATETPAQTAKEAQSGDIQAKKLLAKEAAAQVAPAQATSAQETEKMVH